MNYNEIMDWGEEKMFMVLLTIMRNTRGKRRRAAVIKYWARVE